jgi:CubicO group peptidase (beta-lactamase class C family)
MRKRMIYGRARKRGLGLATTLAFALAVPQALAEVRVSRPESAGVSSPQLATMNREFHALVDSGKLAGVTTLVARRGKVVHFDAYGKRDLETGAPLTKDTIFRIASMTKPVTGVAMMMLYEEGKWRLDDPVSKHIPAFAGLKVRAADGSLGEQAHPMTMRELMSHTAGFDVSGGYTGARDISDPDQPLQAMIDKLAKLPLAAQPGTDWRYGPSVNVQGYIVEQLSGQAVGRVLPGTDLRALEDGRHGLSCAARQGRAARAHAHLRTRRQDHRRTRYRDADDQAGVPGGERRAGLDRRGLLAVRSDAGERWRAGRRAAAQA